MKYEATIKATGEKIRVYKLKSGNYYDYDGIPEYATPSAQKANKKEFAPEELKIEKELK